MVRWDDMISRISKSVVCYQSIVQNKDSKSDKFSKEIDKQMSIKDSKIDGQKGVKDIKLEKFMF